MHLKHCSKYILVPTRELINNCRGEFFGSDFNFLYSEEMQKALASNCLDANRQQLLKFEQYNGVEHFNEELGLLANPQLDLD